MTLLRELIDIPERIYRGDFVLRRTQAADAVWFEAHLGPDVLPRLLRPGRPRMGTKTEPTRAHSVRIEDSVWVAVAVKAKRLGISVNAAVRQAALSWARESRPPARPR